MGGVRVRNLQQRSRDHSRYKPYMEGTSSRRTGTRTGYACDACKRQKIKCSGGQPCQKCTQSGISCEYGNTVGRSAAPYIKHLEDQITGLKALLRQQAAESQASSDKQSSAGETLLDTLVGPEDDYIVIPDETHSSMYHGHFGGLSILRAVRDLCGHPVHSVGDSMADTFGTEMAQAFDSPCLDWPLRNHMAELALLPSRQRLEDTIKTALDVALTCKECIDREDLWRQIDSLYARDPEDFTRTDRSLLALVFALLALGRRHGHEEAEPSQEGPPGRVLVRGLNYFRASRSIIDSQGCGDLNSVMTLCCLASFLLSSSMISKAYGYICTGISAALRMGLHVSSAALRDRLSQDELSKRRRTFAVLNLTAVVIASVLGMPNLLRDADESQLLPLAEEDLPDEGKQFMEANPSSPISATICSAKLYKILAEIIESRTAPHKSASHSPGTFGLDYDTVARFEAEIEKWHADLPHVLPVVDNDRQTLRSQMMLRLQHAAVQISLYRPFLHYVCPDKRSQDLNHRGYSCGSSCLRASTQMIYLVDSMDKHGFLHEAQWYTIYSLALAASSLLLFVLSNQSGPTVDESRHAAHRAVQLLHALGEKNSSARRCYEALGSLAGGVAGGEEGVGGMEAFGEPGTGGGRGEAMSPRTYFFTALGARDVEEDVAMGPGGMGMDE